MKMYRILLRLMGRGFSLQTELEVEVHSLKASLEESEAKVVAANANVSIHANTHMKSEFTLVIIWSMVTSCVGPTGRARTRGG